MKNAILSFISMFFLPIILLRGISAPIEDTPKEVKPTPTPATDVIAFLETDQFMDTFVRFFHDEYTYGGELNGNVLYAMSLLCVNAAYNEKPTFSIPESLDRGDRFGTIKKSDLEHVTEMILGPNVDLTKYHTTLALGEVSYEDYRGFTVWTDGYFPEEDVYRFIYGRDTWNDDPCGIDRSSVQITETDESLVYTATVDQYEMWGSDIIAETKNLTYTFEKNVSDGLMYYKLISIKEN